MKIRRQIYYEFNNQHEFINALNDIICQKKEVDNLPLYY